MSFFEELKRRNVVRVGIAYAVASWLILQVADILLEAFEAPAFTMRIILVILLIGLPLALFFAWAYELTPEGIKKESEVDRSQSIANQTGRPFSSEFRITPSGAFVINRARTVTFQRTPLANETWTVRLAGVDFSLEDLDSNMTRAGVALALADLINADTGAGADWQATTYEDTLIIVSRSGKPFGVAVVITPFLEGQDPADDYTVDDPNAVAATMRTELRQVNI